MDVSVLWQVLEAAKFFQGRSPSILFRSYSVSSCSTVLIEFYKDDALSFLLELHQIEEDIVEKYYPVENDDYGFHIFVGPTEKPFPGL